MSSVPVVRTFCRECYSPPQAVYERLKRAGMDLVTVTDHDSIDAAEALRHYPDFFLSEEVTCRMPSGTTIHIGVYDINERQHVEIQRRRDDLPRLLAYLREQDLLFALKHAFSRLTGRRDPGDLDWFESAFPALEVLNGHIPPSNNQLALDVARRAGKSPLGGSDAHTLLSAGSAFTEVPGARGHEDFIVGLKQGKGRALGEPGNGWKLTREVFSVIGELLRERPMTWFLSPLAMVVPFATMSQWLLELHFARVWRRRIENQSGTETPLLGPTGALRSREMEV